MYWILDNWCLVILKTCVLQLHSVRLIVSDIFPGIEGPAPAFTPGALSPSSPCFPLQTQVSEGGLRKKCFFLECHAVNSA